MFRNWHGYCHFRSGHDWGLDGSACAYYEWSCKLCVYGGPDEALLWTLSIHAQTCLAGGYNLPTAGAMCWLVIRNDFPLNSNSHVRDILVSTSGFSSSSAQLLSLCTGGVCRHNQAFGIVHLLLRAQVTWTFAVPVFRRVDPRRDSAAAAWPSRSRRPCRPLAVAS